MWFSSDTPRRALAPGYRLDKVEGEDRWYEMLDQFDDANIYQTWAYEGSGRRGQTVSRMVLTYRGDLAAMAQARIVTMPAVNLGIAYVRWGPVWRRRGRQSDPEVFRQALRAMRNEYVVERGLTLRILPCVFRDDSPAFGAILAEEGLSPVPDDSADRTLLLNVTGSMEQLRANLKPHWLRELKSAQKRGLEIIEGSDEELFIDFVRIYREMVLRKRFVEPNDIDECVAMQRRLPDRYKMKILLCTSGSAVCAGLVASVVGASAIYLFGATGNAGLKAGGAYLLQWRLLELLNQSGIATYDLNGINPVDNPGTYTFKADMCGERARDTHFLGRFETHPSNLSRSCVALGDRLRVASRALKKRLVTR